MKDTQPSKEENWVAALAVGAVGVDMAAMGVTKHLNHRKLQCKRLEIHRLTLTGNPNTYDKDGMMSLHWAARLNETPSLVKALVDAGTKINARSEKRGLTPLHIAVNSDKLSVVQVLLDAGADLNARTKDEKTPLHLAVLAVKFSKTTEPVKVLLDAGADPKAKDIRGKHLLTWY